MRDLPKLELNLNTPEEFGNVAEMLKEDERRVLANDLIELINMDEGSMNEWAGRAQGYLDRLKNEGDEHPQDREQEGANEEPAPSTEMTLSACITFSAKATDAILGEPDLARASEPNGEPLAAWVSSQLRTKDPNWVLDTDPLVVHMSATGLAWRKRAYDRIDKAFHSTFIPSVGTNRVIINKNVRSVDRAPRITEAFERYPYEIERSIERKRWVDYEPKFDEQDPQAPKEFFECDCWLDLDGDEISEPWTVTMSRDDTPTVVKIEPRWSRKTVTDSDDALFFNPFLRFYPYRMLPDPEGGFFPLGFGKLLDRVEATADILLGSITDTAKSEAGNGGVMGGSQFGIPSQVEIKVNHITTIPTDGQPLDKLLAMWPAKSVSQGSVAVLEKMMTLGDRLAGSLNMLENAPASMSATLAKGVIDSGSQIQSAVHRRLVVSMTQEFHQFVRMADGYGVLPDGLDANNVGGIAVTADPQLATEMQRSALIGFLFELLKAPQVFNPMEIGKFILETARISRPNLLAPPQGPPQATPWEKMQGAVKLMRERTENMKVTGQVAMNLTQALLNMVEAAGGLQNNRAALLTMAQLEQAVQQMMQGAADAGIQLNGMADQGGNQGASGVPETPQDINGPVFSSGGTAGPGAAG